MPCRWASTLRSCWRRDAHRRGRSWSRRLPRMPSRTVAAGPTCGAQVTALMVVPAGGQPARLRRSGQVVLCARASCWPGGYRTGLLPPVPSGLDAADLVREPGRRDPERDICRLAKSMAGMAPSGWQPACYQRDLARGRHGVGWSPALSRGRLGGWMVAVPGRGIGLGGGMRLLWMWKGAACAIRDVGLCTVRKVRPIIEMLVDVAGCGVCVLSAVCGHCPGAAGDGFKVASADAGAEEVRWTA